MEKYIIIWEYHDTHVLYFEKYHELCDKYWNLYHEYRNDDDFKINAYRIIKQEID